jgi:hypothetical protein
MNLTRPLIDVLHDDSRLKRFTQKLTTLRAGQSVGTSPRGPVLPPEPDPTIPFRRAFLGSTLEFMQREYFSEPQPKRNQGSEFEP